ncbi:MAG: hypothetical protein P4L79_08650 [Legionella sp.]|uniref:hypothetical protein n=1 Tax=Legionella sp. TaxID=459 RepID=UPI00285047FA|nr:hypothetical protein [Legionella sp.]
MKRNTEFRIVLAVVGLIPGLLMAAKPVFLITPTQKAPTTIYAGQKAMAIYEIKNNTPYTLNSNGLLNLPKGVQQVGGTCSTPSFNLPIGASCSVNLQINADTLQGNLKGGPVVCNTLVNPIYCSRPSTGDELNVVRSTNPPPETVISASPTSFAFAEGGVMQVVAITNKGPVDAYGIGVKTFPALGVVISGSCPSPLSSVAPHNTCQLTFTSGTTLGSTSATIGGTNTNTLNEQITVTNAAATTLSVAVSSILPAVITVNGTGVALSIQNTGSTTAYHVVYSLPSSWLGVSTAGSCGDIAPGAINACALTFTATLPNLVNTIGFSADNASVVQSPAIAFNYGGGLVFSVSGTSPNALAKAVSTSDLVNTYVWDPNPDCSSNNCTTILWSSGNPSATDGSGNTIDIINSIGSSNPDYAAYQCNQLTVGGASIGDWYLPAICELGSPGNEASCPVVDNIYTNLLAFGFSGISSTAYWSSTEIDLATAWVDDFTFFGEYFGAKYDFGQVRCVRAIPF